MIKSLIYSVILSCLAFMAVNSLSDVSATRSNITFVSINNTTFGFYTGSHGATARGSSSLPFITQLYSILFNTNYKYTLSLDGDFVKLKTPVDIEINGTAYNLSFNDISNLANVNIYNYLSVTIPSTDRVSATDLTKAINVELVDNEQVTFHWTGNQYDSHSRFNDRYVRFQYFLNRWFYANETSKTPTHIIVNGRSFPFRYRAGNNFSYTDAMTDSDLQVSNTNLGPFGINVKYSDGSYLYNTRTHLFTAPLLSQAGMQVANLRKGAGSSYNHWYLFTRPIEALYKGTNLLFRRTNEPTIQSFSVSPTSIDLDTRPTGNLTFSGVVLGTTGQTTNAHIVRVSDGVNIGPNFSAVNGANLVISLPNIAQPTQNESYRLIASNNGGPSDREASVAVTQNVSLTGCVITARSGGPTPGETLSLNCTLKGYPRPRVSVAGWSPNPITDRHYVPVSGQTNTWTFTNLTHFYGTVVQRTIRVTATNSSNTINVDVVHTP